MRTIKNLPHIIMAFLFSKNVPGEMVELNAVVLFARIEQHGDSYRILLY